MRLNMIALANATLTNRYELCRIAAKVTRCIHFASSNTQSAINDAFTHLALRKGLPYSAAQSSMVRKNS